MMLFGALSAALFVMVVERAVQETDFAAEFGSAMKRRVCLFQAAGLPLFRSANQIPRFRYRLTGFRFDWICYPLFRF